MFTLWRWLFPEKPHGEPIHLEFRCGHYMENLKPPVMTEEERQRAQDQADLTVCLRCFQSRPGYSHYAEGYPELQKAMIVVK